MSEIIRDVIGYPMSRDYRRLAELARITSVICVVDNDDMRDLAHTLYYGRGEEGAWYVSVRGTCYIHASDPGKFIERCVKVNLTFVEPDMSLVSATRPAYQIS